MCDCPTLVGRRGRAIVLRAAAGARLVVARSGMKGLKTVEDYARADVAVSFAERDYFEARMVEEMADVAVKEAEGR